MFFVGNFLSEGDEVIVINGGSFGQRWIDICQSLNICVKEVKLEFGKSVKLVDLELVLKKFPKVKAVFATLNETSSGNLTDIESIGNLLRSYSEKLFIVDCISGLISDHMEQDKWNVDVAISASQKAFAIPPGLSFLSMNKKARKFAEQVRIRPYYFDVINYIQNWERNQTPFTPAISLIFQLEARLEKIFNEGLDSVQKRYEELTKYLRTEINRIGLKIIAENPANCVTAISTDLCYNALEIIEVMSSKYHIELAPSGGDLKTKLFRIGTFGNINKNDIDYLLNSLKLTLKEIDERY